MLVVGYLYEKSNWSADDVYFGHLTHLFYSFAKIKDESGLVYEEFIHAHQLLKLKQKNPNLKVILSIGGWGAGYFSETASNPVALEEFVSSTIQLIKQYQFDGVDLDWEYPCTSVAGIKSQPEDKVNFTNMLRAVKKGLSDLSLITKQPYILTAAFGALMGDGRFVELDRIMESLDFINVMTYDLTRNGVASHHSNLYASSVTNQLGSADYINQYLTAGIKPSQLLIGIAFYARKSDQVVIEKNVLGSKVLGTSFGSATFTKLSELLHDESYTYGYDVEAQAPYLYGNQEFYSFDDERSIKEKVQYVKNNHLAGVFFWQYASDETHTLIKAITKAINE
jgi:chitinase